MKKWRGNTFKMIKPFDWDPILEVKGEKNDLMVISRETNGVEVDDAVDLAEERSNFLVLATEHTRVADFY